MYGPSFAAPFVPSQGYGSRRALQSGAAASGSRGALQPATEDGGAPGAAPPSFTIASFNFGFEQNMMMGKKSRKHFDNFQRLCAKIVVDADADFLFGCEVGAFRQGFSRAGINVADILREPFGDNVGFTALHNYVSMWGFGGAPQPVDVSLHGAAAIYWLPLGRDVHAAIARFDVQVNGYGTVHVITGNMHIVCSDNPPSVPARKQMVDHLRQHLNSYRPASSYTLVVRIVLGDNNLKSEDVRKALQRRTDGEALWEVLSTPADLQGDNVAVSGAVATSKTIAVGSSFQDRGMRNDSHDAVAVVFTLPGAAQPVVRS